MAYAIIVRFRAHEGADATMAETLATAARATRPEPGCTRFDVYRAAADSRDFTLVEVYTDAAAFAAHRETPHFAAAMAVLPDLIEERSLVEVSDVAPA